MRAPHPVQPQRSTPTFGTIAVRCAATLVLCAVPPPVAAQDVANEYRLKAAFVYQFPQFVDWPAHAWDSARQVELCVPRPNPFGNELELLVRGESLHGRPYVIRELEAQDSIATCQVLFVSGKPTRPLADLLKQEGARPILTIGDADGFLDDGGMIHLKIVDRRVRFDVNVANAQRAGLRISSQLLNLARSIRGGAP